MRAARMGLAVEVDLQLTMPVRPRFLSELVCVSLDDGLVVEGSDEQQVLRGPAVSNLLPKVLPLLDGTRSLPQITSELPELPPRAIHNAIALLYARGLLEDAAADPIPAPPSSDPDLLAFLRRHIDTTRVNRSGLEALHRLRCAQAGVCAAGAHAEETAAHFVEMLRDAGVGYVRQFDFGSDLRDVFPERTADAVRILVVLVECNENPELLEQLDNQCATLGIRWIRARLDVELLTADLGPYFERGETACYNCFAIANLDAPATRGRSERPQADDPDRLTRRVWADVVASEAIYLLSRVGPMATRGSVVRFNLSTWESERLPVCRLPGCTTCRGARADDQSRTVPVSLAYEDAVGFPSRHLLDPKSHQIHYHAHSLELAHQSKRYLSAPLISLPPASAIPLPTGDALKYVMDGSAGNASQTLTVGRLTALLLFTAGLHSHGSQPDGKLRRWAPTGGNLGSVELYVAAKAVEGLESGVYFYQADGHALARLRPMQTCEVAAFISRAAPGGDAAGALIIFAAAYHRIAQKYASFGYRVVQLDAGVAVAQMLAVGSGIGLKLAIADGRNDVIAEDLDLNPSGELVTSAAHVYGSPYA
jgi:bacteriocin biosynthesis cyclodehydratase domain-containing protein